MIDKIMLLILAGLGLLIVVIVVWEIASEKFELIKSEWKCTEYRPTIIYMPSGKILIPVSTQECIKYEKI